MTRLGKTPFKSFAAPLAVAGSAMLMACTAGATTQAPKQGAGAPACEIVTSRANGMTRVEAVASGDKTFTGTYSLRVSGSGTSIRQGGEFESRAGAETVLGTVSLGGSASAYDIELEMTVGGRTIACARAT